MSLARMAGAEARSGPHRSLVAGLLFLPSLVAGAAGAASSSYLLPDILDNSYQYAISTAGGGAVILGPETLVRLDDAGLPIWAGRPPGTRPLVGAQPFGLRDGDVVIANITPPGAGQLTISRLGADGSLRWAKRVTDPDASVLLTACETAAGNLAVACDDGDTRVSIHSLGATGGSRWMLRASLSERYAFGMAAIDEDALLLALGTQEGALLTRIEPSGAVGWSLLLPGISFRGSTVSRPLPDGSVVLGLGLTPAYSPDARSLLLRVRGDGAILAQALVPVGGDLIATRDGNLLMAGSESAGARADVLVKLSPALDVLWGRRVELIPASNVVWRELADGSFIGCSVLDPAPLDFVTEAFPFLAFLDPDGHAPPGCAVESAVVVTSTRTNVVPARHAPVVTRSAGSADDMVDDWPLIATPTPMPWCSQDGCLSDALEPDSCAREVGRVASGPLRLNFCGDAQDIATMSACAGIVNVVKTSDLGPLADTVLELWSADCSTLLGSDDDGGGGRASRVAFTPSADGQFVVIVRQKDGSVGSLRDYTLTVEPAACDPPAWSARFAVDGEAVQVTAFKAVDDAYVVAGRIPPGLLGDAGVLMRIEADASVAWCRRFEQAGGRAFITSIRPLASGELAVAGSVVTSSGQVQGFLARLAADGSALALQGLDDVAFTDAQRGATGWIAAGGTDAGAAIMSTTDAGTFVWRLIMPLEISGALFAATADGGAIIGGDSRAAPARGWLARVLPTGELAWQRWINVPPTTPVNSLLRFVRSDGGNGARVALTAREGSGDLSMSMLDINNAGDLVREIRYGPPSSGSWSSLWPIGSSDAGDAIGRIVVNDGTTRPGLAIIDRNLGVGAARLSVLWWGESVNEAAVGPSSVMFLDHRDDQELTRLRPSLQRAPECDASFAVTLTSLPPIISLSPASLVTSDIGLGFTSPAVTNVSAVASVLVNCASLACDPPTAAIVSILPPNPCNGSYVQLRGAGTGRGTLTFEWDFDWDGTTFDVDAVGDWIWTVLATGPHDVALRVTDSCIAAPGQAIAVTRVDVQLAGIPIIDGPTSYCAGEPCVTLSVPDAYGDYRWSDGARTPSICVAPTVTTTYSVRVTAGACYWPIQHVVSVDVVPLAASIRETCAPPDHLLTAEAVGGMPPLAFRWDGGETSQSVLSAPGTRSMTITDAGGCSATATWTTTPECGPPGEVSGPADAALRVAGATLSTLSTIAFARNVGARTYNLLVGRVGDWASPVASLSSCHRSDWVDDGTMLSIVATLPVNTWLVVTASNLSGEGPAGAGTPGERSASLAWIGCGASP